MEDNKKTFKLNEIDHDPLRFYGELISVIIPVYNVEKYIHRCVSSIIGQSYVNLEIILVDDCSSDGCPAICDDLAADDDRIKVIHQTTNQGLSVSRNTGVELSTGGIVAFIDGDDYILPDYFARLYGLLIKYNADIAITGFIKEYEGSGKRKPRKNPKRYTLVIEKNDTMEIYLYQKHFITSVCAKLFRKHVIDGIEFPPGKVNEDVSVFYKYIDRADRVVYHSSADYIYVQRTTSIVRTKYREMERDCIGFTEEMRVFISAKYPHLNRASISRCFSANIRILMDIPLNEVYHDDHTEVISNIKKYRSSVLMNPKTRIVSKGCAVISYIGIWFLKIALSAVGRLYYGNNS